MMSISLNSRWNPGAGRDREPVAFVHGVGGDLAVWDHVLAALEDTHPTVRYDLRGHGDSDKPPGPYHLNDFVDDHVRVLNQHGLEGTHLVGFSLGGLIPQATALMHPDRIQKLVLISTVAGRTAKERAAVGRRAQTLRAGGAREHLETAIDRWFTDEFARAKPEIVRSRRERSLRNNLETYAAAYEVLAQADLVEDLHRIEHETLVVTGECDAGSSPRIARLIGERIRNARVVILPRLKHNILLEAPDRVAGLIRCFLALDTAADQEAAS